jgi:POT family proton-dependent oligopeptide transporter
MGYAMLYALMNLGGFLPGPICPPIRKAYGITGSFWLFVFLTLVGILVILFVLTPKAVQEARTESGGTESREGTGAEQEMPLKEKVVYYLKNFPIKDARFMFFIFALIPVQTLFAHNWLTIPQYCTRAFTGVVRDNYEVFVNFSPILIFILTPMVTALTAKRDTYTMMIAGTFVMAAPALILALGPSITTLFSYLILTTIGEAMWSARFLQWVAEIAPKKMTGIYMGIGQFPWFLTKDCPAGVPPEQLHTETMWFIYGLIAIVSPVALLLARSWMRSGFRERTA